MKLKDVPQPLDTCKDAVKLSVDGQFAIARLSLLMAADDWDKTVTFGDWVIWGAAFMVGTLHADNSGEMPIVYQKPIPDEEADIQQPVTKSVARQYESNKYVIALTRGRPVRMRNHMSLVKGTDQPDHGFVAVTRPAETWDVPSMYYWPANCLTLVSLQACIRLAAINSARSHELPQELFDTLYNWKIDVNQALINTPPFKLE